MITITETDHTMIVGMIMGIGVTAHTMIIHTIIDGIMANMQA